MIADLPHENPLLVQLREDPYPFYRELRESAPVQWNEVLGAWTLVRYTDVARALNDARLSNEGRGHVATRARSMLDSDPPHHTRLRSLVNKAFTPRMAEELRPRIVAIVSELLGRIAEREEPFDLIADLAYPLPVLVITELLGVPAEDRGKFKEWSSVLIAIRDPVAGVAVRERVRTAGDALNTYLREIIAERRRRPASDLISALVSVEEQGDVLGEPELVGMCALLLVAGHETTANLIGNGVLALLRNPEQLARLQADRSLIGSAVEELLRFDSPTQLTLGRIALEPVAFDGYVVEPGQRVLPMLGAANHDPAQFTDPDSLDLGRTPNPHLAFGRGIHFCLGAPLARLEGQIAIGGLVQRFKQLSLAGEPVRRDQINLRGLRSLPMRAVD